MTDPIRSYLIRKISRHAPLPKGVDLDTFDYVASGHVDSIAIMKFVVDLEVRFDIEITEEDMVLPGFRTIGGLVAILHRKIAADSLGASSE
ncbi:MAG: hypothetical protein JXR77_12310 [Lentisphaeria bacterium]|nr:hypothetical protein [Lentisphaeria bacterium]